jgi:phosphoglucomutase
MSILYDEQTQLCLGDPASLPQGRHEAPGDASSRAEAVRTAASGMLRTVSGWRKIFAADMTDHGDTLTGTDIDLICCVAAAYHAYLADSVSASTQVGIAVDSRPTGGAIANVLIRCFVSLGLTPHYLFICPTPQLMAASAAPEVGFSEFIMITASHNPVGYNGFKFGREGTVLPTQEHTRLQGVFEQLVSDNPRILAAADLTQTAPAPAVEQILNSVTPLRRSSAQCYETLVEAALGPGGAVGFSALRAVYRQAFLQRRLGVVVDHNGGARCTSIDREFFESLGVTVQGLNDNAREIRHAIQPEGDALMPCCRALEAAHRDNPGFLLGYVTDNDGDRGTTVMIADGVARPMEAQEVFALACVSRLATLVYQGEIRYNEHGRCTSKVALVCNGPTSLRIDRIAETFDVEVFRAEVGEANVVGLAKDLRTRGYLVPILGEGSNGGCIIPPAQVRDPLLTVGSILSLLLPPAPNAKQTRTRTYTSPTAAWCERLSISPPTGNIQPTELLDLLPVFSTTGVTEDRAVVQLHTQDYAGLKNAYESVFRKEWQWAKNEFHSRYGFSSYEVVNHIGPEERCGEGPSYRQGSERSGMKLLFKDGGGKPAGFIWMRPSGTEPVFRVCADIEGARPADEAELLRVHTELIHRAEASVLRA